MKKLRTITCEVPWVSREPRRCMGHGFQVAVSQLHPPNPGPSILEHPSFSGSCRFGYPTKGAYCLPPPKVSRKLRRSKAQATLSNSRNRLLLDPSLGTKSGQDAGFCGSYAVVLRARIVFQTLVRMRYDRREVEQKELLPQ